MTEVQTAELQSTIDRVLEEVLSSRAEAPPRITQELRLIDDLHLDSLRIAQLVATLELETGVDPFSSFIAITKVESVADLYRAYAGCIESGGAESR